MPPYGPYVQTDDLLVVGEGFPAQWPECLSDRAAYAYIIPEPGEPQWPFILCVFSRQKFTLAELRALCRGDEAPIQRREREGEERCGFFWPLDALKLEAVSEQGQAILEALHV